MKNSLLSILSVFLFFLFFIIGCNLLNNKPLGEDVKNRNIKIYSIKITPKDYEKSPETKLTQDCTDLPPQCLVMNSDSSFFDISFCITCETTGNDTMYSPQTNLQFINTPSHSFTGPRVSGPPYIVCNNGSFTPTYTVQFDTPIGNNPDDSLAFRVVSNSNSSTTYSIDTTFTFPICSASNE